MKWPNLLKEFGSDGRLCIQIIKQKFSYVAALLMKGGRLEWDWRTRDPIGGHLVDRPGGRGHQRGRPVRLKVRKFSFKMKFVVLRTKDSIEDKLKIAIQAIRQCLHSIFFNQEIQSSKSTSGWCHAIYGRFSLKIVSKEPKAFSC